MKKENKMDKAAGFSIVGGLLIGIGVGILKGFVAAGVLIGLGAGFIVAMILILLKKN